MLSRARTYIIIKNIKELEVAKQNHLCMHIIYESNNFIYIWNRINSKWSKTVYSVYGKVKELDFETTGLKAYQSFYYYCGVEEVEKMKLILSPIDVWDSYEQMHYANIDFIGQKIYKNIYEFDANSSFTFGVFQLQEGFEKLKEYYDYLYNQKENAKNQLIRSKYKNLQNYLIGYFARVKQFVALRSNIIFNSNMNIVSKMKEIKREGGEVYLSNTDSIVTDDIGNEVMQQYIGTKAGQFKLQIKTDRLFYNSSNSYQIGEKVVYSGVKYFARKYTDFFKELYAEQEGNLVVGYDFDFEYENEEYKNLCRVKNSEIKVKVYNKIGELVDIIIYKGRL